MKNNQFGKQASLFVIIGLSTGFPSVDARAEMQCNPAGQQQALSTEGDKFFQGSLKDWASVTTERYLEGDHPDACVDFAVPGYEDFPTKKCDYRTHDAGDPKKPLAAKVILFNPSAKQLTSWSIHACRTNGATDAEMPNCLLQLFTYVKGQHGAQFPVAGSAVESVCSSSTCKALPSNHPDREPRNTLFRNGVSISYSTLAHWTKRQLSDNTYNSLFNTKASDVDISEWYKYARVSGALRGDWSAWRKKIGKPLAPEGADPKTFDLAGSGWGEVSRLVHQTACKSEGNELFDALVFSQRWAK